MGTMNFSIPDDVKDRFNEVFEGRNKSEIVARLLSEATEREERRRASQDFVERMRRIRARSPGFTAEEIRRAREDGRP